MKPTNQFLFKVTVFTTAAFFFVFGAFALNSSGVDRAVGAEYPAETENRLKGMKLPLSAAN